MCLHGGKSHFLSYQRLYIPTTVRLERDRTWSKATRHIRKIDLRVTGTMGHCVVVMTGKPTMVGSSLKLGILGWLASREPTGTPTHLLGWCQIPALTHMASLSFVVWARLL